MGRVIQTVEKNHLGGISRTSIKYDLAGNILKKHESHQRGPGLTADTKLTTFTYDVRGRMLTEATSINGSTSGTVTYAYNELGQLTGKTSGNGATESIAYNIQGWLSSKNAVRSGTNLFSMNLLYYNSSRATNKYTGNIVEWQWTQGTGSQNSYALTYDKLDRLTNSNRYVAGTATNAFTEKNLTYDKNGNIKQLQRYGSSGSTLQDNFTYNYNGSTYNGNQLSSISGSVSASYAYDNNGNMTTDGRKNLTITYNLLNLQQTLSQSGTPVATYSWLADGTKCAVVDNTTNGFDYLGSLKYTRNGSTRTLESTDFGGGRVVYSGGVYTRYYYTTDHLGSVRVITDNSGVVQERNDYYPFGGRHVNGSIILPVNKQKFNGKELQTTGFLDYGARMYDDAIGRWSVVDPLGEKYYSTSPYAYCANNPINLIDPDGKDWAEVETGDGKNIKKEIKWFESHEAFKNSQQKGTYLGKAVVIFNGSKDEKLAKDGTVNGKDAKPAYATVYGINGEDDVQTYKGLTMSSDPSKFSVLNEGWYDGTPDKMSNDRVYNYFSKNDKINGKDPNESLPYRLSANGDTELDGTRNGQPIKMNGVFFHRIDNDGNAGMINSTQGRSEGCPVVNGGNWRDIKKSIGTNIIIKVGIFRK